MVDLDIYSLRWVYWFTIIVDVLDRDAIGGNQLMGRYKGTIFIATIVDGDE